MLGLMRRKTKYDQKISGKVGYPEEKVEKLAGKKIGSQLNHCRALEVAEFAAAAGRCDACVFQPCYIRRQGEPAGSD
jgi:hypothetical protein